MSSGRVMSSRGAILGPNSSQHPSTGSRRALPSDTGSGNDTGIETFLRRCAFETREISSRELELVGQLKGGKEACLANRQHRSATHRMRQ